MTELKNRIDQVVELLTGLAAGDLDARGERSPEDDDLDAVVVGINMLAEELGAQRAEMAERIIALKAAQQEALAASRVKSVFVANVSHEIRTPLATVLATAEILGDTSLDEPQLELVKKLQRSGERLLKLIEEILDFSRIEAGQHVLASTVFDLHALTAEVADVYVPRATREGIGFEWHLDPRVPRMVVGDPDRLFQVLTNLLDNAVKFTHQGTVDLVVRPVKVDHEGDGAVEVVEFIVEDTGIGVPATDQESVFDSFNQADGSTTRRYAGTGLGLAICKELTHLMGGTITLQSRVGVGSTFTLHLPLAHAVADCDGSRHDSPPHAIASRVRTDFT